MTSDPFRIPLLTTAGRRIAAIRLMAAASRDDGAVELAASLAMERRQAAGDGRLAAVVPALWKSEARTASVRGAPETTARSSKAKSLRPHSLGVGLTD